MQSQRKRSIRSIPAKYTVHLDLHSHFQPIMSDHGRGVVLTRQLELPFVPVIGLPLFSRAMDECQEPQGFPISSVIWDLDRQVFLADTGICHADTPPLEIVYWLKEFLGRGWSFGSYRDAYAEKGAAVSESSELGDAELLESELPDEGDDVLTKGWRKRSPSQNRVLRALIRHAATTFDNEAAAYALDRTGRYFDEYQIENKSLHDKNVRAFLDAKEAYSEMTFAEKDQWRERTRRYASLEILVHRGL